MPQLINKHFKLLSPNQSHRLGMVQTIGHAAIHNHMFKVWVNLLVAVTDLLSFGNFCSVII